MSDEESGYADTIVEEEEEQSEDIVPPINIAEELPPRRARKMVKQEELERARKARIASFQRQKELRSDVVKLLELLMEGAIGEQLLLEKSLFLSKSCYDDLATERSLTQLCGYPICGKALPKHIPKQQYKIDIRSNKVYDITERKQFCSNLCFKASSFFKEQLEEQPLWLRDDATKASMTRKLTSLKLYAEKKGLPGTEMKYDIVSDELNTLVSDISKLQV
ncbi:putative RNA polymerase II subunit B1 CTD phosphatase RPAP2 [Halotydeus destructor]|nr:putative RNA polymerase II subunit B1 CTD phosphatase RPAP2 [Halotydeus destructor]